MAAVASSRTSSARLPSNQTMTSLIIGNLPAMKLPCAAGVIDVTDNARSQTAVTDGGQHRERSWPAPRHERARQPAQPVHLVDQVEHDGNGFVVQAEIVTQLGNQTRARNIDVVEFAARAVSVWP